VAAKPSVRMTYAAASRILSRVPLDE
jgi:hypothetical protein